MDVNKLGKKCFFVSDICDGICNPLMGCIHIVYIKYEKRHDFMSWRDLIYSSTCFFNFLRVLLSNSFLRRRIVAGVTSTNSSSRI